MTYIHYLLNWRWINTLAPFVGIIGCVFVFYSHKTCTQRKAVSTAISLAIMLWLMLIWADWGSTIFTPSYQSMWSRIFLLIMSTLLLYELRRHTRENIDLRHKNIALSRENIRLKLYNEYLLLLTKDKKD